MKNVNITEYSDLESLNIAIRIKDKILKKIILNDQQLFDKVWEIQQASKIISNFYCLYMTEPNNFKDYKIKVEECLKKCIEL